MSIAPKSKITIRKDRILFVGMVAVVWSILFFPLVWPVYLHIWAAFGVAAYFGALIFGTIGVGAIVRDVYQEFRNKVD